MERCVAIPYRRNILVRNQLRLATQLAFSPTSRTPLSESHSIFLPSNAHVITSALTQFCAYAGNPSITEGLVVGKISNVTGLSNQSLLLQDQAFSNRGVRSVKHRLTVQI